MHGGENLDAQIGEGLVGGHLGIPLLEVAQYVPLSRMLGDLQHFETNLSGREKLSRNIYLWGESDNSPTLPVACKYLTIWKI